MPEKKKYYKLLYFRHRKDQRLKVILKTADWSSNKLDCAYHIHQQSCVLSTTSLRGMYIAFNHIENICKQIKKN